METFSLPIPTVVDHPREGSDVMDLERAVVVGCNRLRLRNRSHVLSSTGSLT